MGFQALPASPLLFSIQLLYSVDWPEVYQLGGQEVSTGRAWVEGRIRLSVLCLRLGSGQWVSGSLEVSSSTFTSGGGGG